MVVPLQRRSTNDQGGTLDDVRMSVRMCMHTCMHACMSYAYKLPNTITLVVVWLPSHPGILFSHPQPLPKNTSPVWDVVLLVKYVLIELLGCWFHLRPHRISCTRPYIIRDHMR